MTAKNQENEEWRYLRGGKRIDPVGPRNRVVEEAEYATTPLQVRFNEKQQESTHRLSVDAAEELGQNLLEAVENYRALHEQNNE